METIKTGEMGSVAGAAKQSETGLKGIQEGSVSARRRSMAYARRLWTREDGFTVAGARRG